MATAPGRPRGHPARFAAPAARGGRRRDVRPRMKQRCPYPPAKRSSPWSTARTAPSRSCRATGCAARTCPTARPASSSSTWAWPEHGPGHRGRGIAPHLRLQGHLPEPRADPRGGPVVASRAPIVQGRVAAEREAAEELGIRGAKLEPRFDFHYEDERNRCFGRVFTCVHEGPFTLQAEEVESVEFLTADEIAAGRAAPLTPDTLLAFTSGSWNPRTPAAHATPRGEGGAAAGAGTSTVRGAARPAGSRRLRPAESRRSWTRPSRSRPRRLDGPRAARRTRAPARPSPPSGAGSRLLVPDGRERSPTIQGLDRVPGKAPVVAREVPGDFDAAGAKGRGHRLQPAPNPAVRMAPGMAPCLRRPTHRTHERIVLRSGAFPGAHRQGHAFQRAPAFIRERILGQGAVDVRRPPPGKGAALGLLPIPVVAPHVDRQPGRDCSTQNASRRNKQGGLRLRTALYCAVYRLLTHSTASHREATLHGGERRWPS